MVRLAQHAQALGARLAMRRINAVWERPKMPQAVLWVRYEKIRASVARREAGAVSWRGADY